MKPANNRDLVTVDQSLNESEIGSMISKRRKMKTDLQKSISSTRNPINHELRNKEHIKSIVKIKTGKRRAYVLKPPID